MLVGSSAHSQTLNFAVSSVHDSRQGHPWRGRAIFSNNLRTSRNCLRPVAYNSIPQSLTLNNSLQATDIVVASTRIRALHSEVTMQQFLVAGKFWKRSPVRAVHSLIICMLLRPLCWWREFWERSAGSLQRMVFSCFFTVLNSCLVSDYQPPTYCSRRLQDGVSMASPLRRSCWSRQKRALLMISCLDLLSCQHCSCSLLT